MGSRNRKLQARRILEQKMSEKQNNTLKHHYTKVKYVSGASQAPPGPLRGASPANPKSLRPKQGGESQVTPPASASGHATKRNNK